MKKRYKMTFEDHVQFARALKTVRDFMFIATGQGGKAGRSAITFEKRLGRMRCAFDGLLFEKYPNQAKPDIYYGE
jgi:hypothetical protein